MWHSSQQHGGQQGLGATQVAFIRRRGCLVPRQPLLPRCAVCGNALSVRRYVRTMSYMFGTFVALSDAVMYAWSVWDCLFLIVFLILCVFVFAFVMGESHGRQLLRLRCWAAWASSPTAVAATVERGAGVAGA